MLHILFCVQVYKPSYLIPLQVKNATYALWTWYRNQDSEKVAGDQIYIVRQPDECAVRSKVTKGWSNVK